MVLHWELVGQIGASMGATFVDDMGSKMGSIVLQVSTLPGEVFCVSGFEDTICETVCDC